MTTPPSSFEKPATYLQISRISYLPFARTGNSLLNSRFRCSRPNNRPRRNASTSSSISSANVFVSWRSRSRFIHAELYQPHVIGTRTSRLTREPKTNRQWYLDHLPSGRYHRLVNGTLVGMRVL